MAFPDIILDDSPSEQYSSAAFQCTLYLSSAHLPPSSKWLIGPYDIAKWLLLLYYPQKQIKPPAVQGIDSESH